MMKTKPHPIINKLKYAVRHSNLWRTKTIINKKKEQVDVWSEFKIGGNN